MTARAHVERVQMIFIDNHWVENTPELGDLVKDRITGFLGVIIAMTRYLQGCERAGIRPCELKDGLPQEPQFFDVTELDVVEKTVVFSEKVEHDTKEPPLPGGPRTEPPL